MSEQLSLFDLPPIDEHFTVSIPPLRRAIWTEHKAKLIERYLYYFVLVTKHGTYLDGFAGPQLPDQPETWAAKLVLESEPRRLRRFFLCDSDPPKVKLLQELVDRQPPRRKGEPERIIQVYDRDFNESVHDILASGLITEKEATFCLLDQQTFECHWSTVEALARHKRKGFKIELFYFLADGWLDRALAAQRDTSVLEVWWGDSEWSKLRDIKSVHRAAMLSERFRAQLAYRSALSWPIYNQDRRVMYYMIHCTDYPTAPNLMSRAYRRALEEKEPPEQFVMEFGAWQSP